MSNDASSSERKPLSPARRKQLQQCFEHGNKKMTSGEFDYANEMFSQCVSSDPGNVIYAQTFVGNLRQKYGNNKKGSKMSFISGAKARGLLKKAELGKNWDSVIKHGVEILQLDPWDVGALTAMGKATAALGYTESQLAYLRMALDKNPDDPDVNRLCAIELRERGQFDQALACWTRVLKSRPDDVEAKKTSADITVEKTIEKGRYEDADLKTTRSTMQQEGTGPQLTPEQALEKEIKGDPKNAGNYRELADLHLNQDRWTEAEDVLKRGAEALPDDLDLKERWLSIQVDHMQRKLREMKDKYETSPSEELKKEFYNLKKEYTEKQLDVQRFRVERFPTNPGFRFDLAATYQQHGMYKEAIGEFQQAKADGTRRGVCLLALGQCFQQIKQYRLAMNHYEEAVEAISEQDFDNRKKVLYLAAKLAYGLKDYDTAEKHAEVLAGIDFSYKDVGDLLDKIATQRQDSD